MDIFEITDDAVNKAWSGTDGYCFSMKDYNLKNVSEFADGNIPDNVSKSQLMFTLGCIPYVTVNDVEIMRAFINDIDNKKLKSVFEKVEDKDYVETFWKYCNIYPEIRDRYGDFEHNFVKSKIVEWCEENGINYKLK